MAYSPKLMFRISYLSDSDGYRREAESFLKEWMGGGDFITAHTSGSTGRPKEILLPKKDMLVSARATNRRFGIDSHSRMLCPLSARYIAGKMMIVRAYEAGCEVAFCAPSNDFWEKEETVRYMAQGDVALLPIVPSQAISLLKSRNHPALLPVRNIIIGGASLPSETEEQLIASLPGVTEAFATYGMTETCSHVALRKLGNGNFNAMPGIAFSSDDRDCLIIIAPEYSFGRLQTNDIVTLRGDDRFIWRGRFDNVINSGGIKIFPEEVERKLEGLLPSRFYLKGVPDPKWGETAALVIEDTPDIREIPDKQLLAICNSVLTGAERPKLVIRIATFPLTSNGKIKRI